MVEQKERTRITQSGEKLRHQLRHHPGLALDLKTRDLIVD